MIKVEAKHIKDSTRETVRVERELRHCSSKDIAPEFLTPPFRITSSAKGMVLEGSPLWIETVTELREYAKIIADSWKDREFFSEKTREGLML